MSYIGNGISEEYLNQRPIVFMPVHHVGTGEYVVKRKESVRLVAYLGSCVGVALVDVKNGVSGMIHLLLPEPVSPEPDANLSKYASTGLPLLLKQMLEKGADRRNIKATVAGGALVGVAQALDLSLNIGGRIADQVNLFLESEGIPVDRSETGGFFTCNLSLNAMDCTVDIKPCWNDGKTPTITDRVPDPPIKPTQSQLSSVMESIVPIPQVGLKVLRLLDEGSHSLGPIVSEIKQDQVISGRIIRESNSALLVRDRQVESVSEAALVLGEHQLAKIIMAEAFDRFYGQCKQGYSICRGGLYHHAVGTAILAEKIALITGKERPAAAYTAGLVHDIGKVVLDQWVADAWPFFYRQIETTDKPLTEIEKETFGTDHTEIGSLLAGMWRFPERLIHTIRHHHDLECGRAPLLTRIVFLADLLMSRFQTGYEYEVIDAGLLESCLDSLEISKQKVDMLVDMMALPGYGIAA